MNPTMHKAYKAWQNAARLRSRRLKFKRYTFGDQWGDIVTISVLMYYCVLNYPLNPPY